VFIAESDNKNPLPVLWHQTFSVYYLPVQIVPQLIFQRVMHHAKSIAPVMIYKVFHVFQQKGGGPLMRYDPRDIKKQGTLRFAGKSMVAPKRVLLGYARN